MTIDKPYSPDSQWIVVHRPRRCNFRTVFVVVVLYARSSSYLDACMYNIYRGRGRCCQSLLGRSPAQFVRILRLYDLALRWTRHIDIWE